MKIIDTHLHILSEPDVEKEKSLSLNENLSKLFVNLSARVEQSQIEKGLAIILDERFLTEEKAVDALRSLPANLFFSVMLDFRKRDCLSLLDKAVSLGAKALKFHPFHQQIEENDYHKARKLISLAEKNNLNTIVDTNVIDFKGFSPLKFAQFVCSQVKTPVILAHAGGLKALEALVLCLDHSNAFLESSFSVPFWMGSSIEKDLAFAFKKIGSERCLYGSDAPFVFLGNSLEKTDLFLRRNGFSEKEMEDIMYKTAEKIYGKS